MGKKTIFELDHETLQWTVTETDIDQVYVCPMNNYWRILQLMQVAVEKLQKEIQEKK